MGAASKLASHLGHPSAPVFVSSFAGTFGRFRGQTTPAADICVQVLAWPLAWRPPLQSRPLNLLLTHCFFLALLPYPSCPLWSWLLGTVVTTFPVTRNALSHHRAFPRHFFPQLST